MNVPLDDSYGKQKARRARILNSYLEVADQLPDQLPGQRAWDTDQGSEEWDEVLDRGDGALPTCCTREATRYCSVDEGTLPFKLLYIFFRGGIACISPYLTVFMSFMSLPPSTIGILLAIPSLFIALLTPVCGVLADRFNARKAILLIFLSIWILCILCVNFLQPPEQTPCTAIADKLQDVSRHPKTGPQEQFNKCLNTSIDMDSHPTRYKQATTSLLQLPNPISGFDKTCKPLIGTKDYFITDLFLPSSGDIRGLLFESKSLMQTFVTVFVLLSLGEVMQRPTMSLTDTATLNELGEQSWDRYGWQRSFGSAGFAVYSIAIAFVISVLRFPHIICGIEIEVIDYRICTVTFGGTVACAFGLLFASCFKFKYYTTAEYKFSNVLPAICSGYYGSVMATAFALAVCNGCVYGYFFWHLRNLGATEFTVGLILAIRAGSELLLAFHTPRLIRCLGHVELLVVGLLAYFVRFICYATIVNPWLFLPVEVIHGMSIALTWNVLVCFMCRSVPMECMATLQGFLSGTYFGLGQGVGTLISGFLISSYGVSMTFYAFAVAILCYSVVFVTIFKISKQPKRPMSSYQMMPSSFIL
ncbi:major facilitator superfamily domain-containing protein 6-like [Asterias rubens]|uniref:major facilitator superfamily domain-containing protein 6-like n=1 Tax=Asterias rubens TaxID=7604 RepID=UPI001455DB87|nr:major facilitator superfamily domain-containing protein 6-like [Asterias rubens]XP_033642916.1 major facilitator superfamily domain-containing protein 6-like [Asterias rubens]